MLLRLFFNLLAPLPCCSRRNETHQKCENAATVTFDYAHRSSARSMDEQQQPNKKLGNNTKRGGNGGRRRIANKLREAALPVAVLTAVAREDTAAAAHPQVC